MRDELTTEITRHLHEWRTTSELIGLIRKDRIFANRHQQLANFLAYFSPGLAETFRGPSFGSVYVIMLEMEEAGTVVSRWRNPSAQKPRLREYATLVASRWYTGEK